MTVAVEVKITGDENLRRLLRRMSPQSNPAWVRRGMLKVGFQMQTLAASKYILRGGGPRAPVHPTMLTSRTGTLRRSIAVNRRRLPFTVSVGTHLRYGRTHELGLGPYPRRAFLDPALQEVAKTAANVLAEEWEKETRGPRVSGT